MGTVLVVASDPDHPGQPEFGGTLVGEQHNHSVGLGSVSSVPDDNLVMVV